MDRIMTVARTISYLCLALSWFSLSRAPLHGGAPVPAEVRLLFGGDVMVHQRVKRAARAAHQGPDTTPEGNRGWNSLFAPIREAVTRADLALANLETPILPAPPVDPFFLASGAFPAYKAPAELPRALAWAGFDLLSIANNHALDQGTHGVTSTITAVRGAGLKPVGGGPSRVASLAPVCVHAGNMKVGVFGATGFLNEPRRFAEGEPQVNILGPSTVARMLDLVRRSRASLDIIVLSVHWGEEQSIRPREREVALARRFCEAGVDVVVGHHPHVLQPMEIHRSAGGRLSVIAYSLGNLLTGNPAAGWRSSALLEVAARRDLSGHVSLSGYGHHALWTELSPEGVRVVDARLALATATGPGPGPGQPGRIGALRACVAHAARVLGAEWVDLAAPAFLMEARSPGPSPGD